MKEVTDDDEHVHNDSSSKELPELVENIIKSDSVTAIGKLFVDDGAYEGNEIFRYLEGNGILPCIKVRKRMLELDGKKGLLSEIYYCWYKEMIYKNGRTTALAMERDGLSKQCYPP